MESNNSILNGNSAESQESLPITTSLLDKSKSLFGSPPGIRPVPVACDTPLDETPPSTESAVAMETEDPVESKSSPNGSPTKAVEPEDTSEPAVEEETFEKKTVSMDTSENVEEVDEGQVDGIEENGEENGEEEEDEEEEEVPKKKAKRAASVSEEDDEEKSDDQQMETESPDLEEAAPAEEKPESPVPSASASAEAEAEALTDELPSDIPNDTIEEEEANSSQPAESEEPENAENAEMEEVAEESVEDAVEQSSEAVDEGVQSPKAEATPERVEAPPTAPRSSRGRRSQAQATPQSATPKRSVRGRPSIIQATEDDSTTERVTTPRRGRPSRSAPVKDDDTEEQEVADEAEAVEEPEETTSAKRGRGRRSVAVKEEEAAPEETVEEQADGEEAVKEPAKPPAKTRWLGRRSAAEHVPRAQPPTPSSTRGRGKKAQVAEEPEKEQPVDAEGEEAEESSPKKPARRGRKSKEAQAEEVEEAPAEESTPSSSRRSTRVRKSPKEATPVVETKRGRKKQVSVGEEAAEDGDDTTPTSSAKRGRKSTKSAASSSKKNDDFDPYNLDTEMEHHPEPLRNIHFQMEVQNFGAVKYAKAGKSESKYSMTEKAAVSRIAELQTSPVVVKERRSLADMTPGKEKQKPRASTGRRSKAKKEETNDVEMEDVSADTTETKTPSNRGRKRKSEGSELAPSAKREPEIVLRELSDEEQLQADHPQDGEDNHSPGARVYAIFQKTFYPAVILNERDALGRFKLQFTMDKVVKDVPNSGIIPLRALVPDKLAIYEDGDVRVLSGPDDISAEEWSKGKVTIAVLDDDGEPTGEKKTVDWKELTFDLSEWRDYIKTTEQSAAAVATSNITTIPHGSRPRKPVYTQKITAGRRKKHATDASRDGTPMDTDDDQLLPMKEDAIDKKIFSGKIFILTSANRSSPVNTTPMFKKKNLSDFLALHGGIVTENYEMYTGSETPMYLVSDTYYRTHKYLAALARGIPCISNVWLQKCGEQGEFVDYSPYILPAGSSIFDDTETPAPEKPSELLKGKTIFVFSTHPNREVTQVGPGGTFTEIWSPILNLLGATVVDCDYETLVENDTQFDVALLDKTVSDEVMAYADKIGASKVTSEWVIQTIILGEAPEPTGHPKFDPNRLHHRTRRLSSSS
uniref:BRCT domain-containing protein n=1 Tax=Caenorhabditis tropicalis TaxID=1561998 RepID=A0A1I7U483_9PELO